MALILTSDVPRPPPGASGTIRSKGSSAAAGESRIDAAPTGSTHPFSARARRHGSAFDEVRWRAATGEPLVDRRQAAALPIPGVVALDETAADAAEIRPLLGPAIE